MENQTENTNVTYENKPQLSRCINHFAESAAQ